VRENVKLVTHALEVMGGASSVTPRMARLRAKLTHARGDFGIAVGRASLQGLVFVDTPDRLLIQLKTVGMGRFFSLARDEVELEYLP